MFDPIDPFKGDLVIQHNRDGGQGLGPGLYFCQLETSAIRETKRMVLTH